MGRHMRATGVYRAVAQELKTDLFPGMRTHEPPWFNLMYRIPPAECLSRPIAPGHGPSEHGSTRLPKPFRPQELLYLEDKLRNTFYRDHPWELARPRIIAEDDGKDYQRCDWSKGPRQPGIALSGECVVQRQMWLMDNENKCENEAYDQARREFYRLRQAEEVAQRIAVEEAKYVGAYFGKSKLDIGMMLEDREFETWKVWAGKETELRETKAAEEERDPDEEDAVDLEKSAAAPAAAPAAP